MRMRDSRSRSQILFSLLPEQTVDLKGRIWKVTEWASPEYLQVDDRRMRAALIGELEHWRGRDSGFAQGIRSGLELHVRSLNMDAGVLVKEFPKTFQCKTCRVVSDSRRQCAHCAGRSFGQLPFVGYHDCGRSYEPRIAACPKHKMARINRAYSARAADIRFDCPVCGLQLQKGLGVRPCDCGSGVILYLPHRAGSVYQSQMLTLVNPASRDAVQRLMDRGGPDGSLRRAITGSGIDAADATSYADLKARLHGLPPEVQDSLLQQAVDSGAVRPPEADPDFSAVPESNLQVARESAFEVDLAFDGGRLDITELRDAKDDAEPHRESVRTRYARALESAGLMKVELADSFPILRAAYGYTRGSKADVAVLQPFRAKRGGYLLLADNGITEALFFQLDPQRLHRWLARRHQGFAPAASEAGARLDILRVATVPSRFSDPSGMPGDSLVTLLHSMSHRLIRRLSVLAGIDREALGEHLIPSHGAFFIYAQPRGEFVLGGLQAVFESELDRLLSDVVQAEHRCALDPGCVEARGACPACLHLGEPVCRWFNRRLDRKVLFGQSGYWSDVLSIRRQ